MLLTLEQMRLVADYEASLSGGAPLEAGRLEELRELQEFCEETYGESVVSDPEGLKN